MKSNLRSVSIRNICLGIYDGPHATPPKSDTGAIFLGIPNFVNGKLNLSPSNIRYISEKDFPKWTKRVTPKAHDIVFSYEATLNLYAIIPDDFHGCLGRRMALIRPDESVVDYRFLYYYMFSPAWRKEIERHKVNGSTVDRIPLVSFPSFCVNLPNMCTQKAIADILFSIDQKIDGNNKINDNLAA
ncbi:MAG TPA: restriction endonuclease subunit S [Candidatus Lachnoclostridium pullistercoris]|uniref:Restriction endonuclease subunit S n=1 Tax=Candidatus Lachnoclostridium pullistercoris TaxID=2838632 RepID=A0A9D2T6H5_9FIRM|nr:restriction endonuclease subunit S [Candidatus Lachnoclostridium pullistercoris]